MARLESKNLGSPDETRPFTDKAVTEHPKAASGGRVQKRALRRQVELVGYGSCVVPLVMGTAVW
jgi:hypothetical protein